MGSRPPAADGVTAVQGEGRLRGGFAAQSESRWQSAHPAARARTGRGSASERSTGNRKRSSAGNVVAASRRTSPRFSPCGASSERNSTRGAAPGGHLHASSSPARCPFDHQRGPQRGGLRAEAGDGGLHARPCPRRRCAGRGHALDGPVRQPASTQPGAASDRAPAAAPVPRSSAGIELFCRSLNRCTSSRQARGLRDGPQRAHQIAVGAARVVLARWPAPPRAARPGRWSLRPSAAPAREGQHLRLIGAAQPGEHPDGFLPRPARAGRPAAC